ncbi:RING-H2 finger protein ATL74-like [Tripterygium wilfordii]|uniref:RING-H2 finger protein ATL74-like n=1 Tax=Tripterygium wilfordii TaxID=458696 RepID=UPI0018F81BD3|nr:RING-H2 finger protein ATL74-like [Tripterygium wilfordii]
MTISTLHRRPHRLLLGTGADGSPSETSGGRTWSSSTNEANFDTNMVIILSALLCALICVLGFNSIFRCALRCSRRFAFETPDETAARLDAATGLKESALRQIPVVVYGAAQINIVATDCTICLGEFVGGEKVRVLPMCNHGFHVKCIDTWLVSHSNCPTCRRSLLDQVLTTSDAASTAGGHGDAHMTADEVG